MNKTKTIPKGALNLTTNKSNTQHIKACSSIHPIIQISNQNMVRHNKEKHISKHI